VRLAARSGPLTDTAMASVFISYTHDSPEHRARVLHLAQRLRRDGLDCALDAFILGHPEEGWPLWMETQMEQADFVLLICTETYHRRFSGKEREGVGAGAVFESHLTRDALYAEHGRNRKYVPVLFEDGTEDDVPVLLRRRYTRYVLPREYEDLLRYLTKQPRVVPEPVGPVRPLPPGPGGADAEEEDRTFSSPIREHMTLLSRHVEHLTQEQFRVIRQLRGLRRVRISGCPGSGKTLVATEKAIRLAEAGLFTLFLCHNPLLAAHVRGLARGSGVVVQSFGEWVAGAADEGGPRQTEGWTHYDEPDSATLGRAFDAVVEHGPRYDAVIVDEGQDFRGEWWAIVEAALLAGPAGILYVFHDDLQALLPFRASYPIDGPPIDLSRNCRNAGRVYELMRKVHPDAPLPEESLLKLGDILVIVYDRGDEADAVGRGLRWIHEQGLGDAAVALHGGTGSVHEALRCGDYAARPGLDWQREIRHVFRQLVDTCAYLNDDDLRAPFTFHVDEVLAALSTDPFPTADDVQRVRSLAGLFRVQGEYLWRREARSVRWVVRDGGEVSLACTSRGVEWPLDVLQHLERGDWHHGIPNPGRVRIRHHEAAAPGDVPLYRVPEFKGLEADAVLLVLEGPGADLERHAYVGISRARVLLALLVERETVPALPYALRRSSVLRGLSSGARDGG
jgi:SEFIR domain